jgi:glycine/D-amino acid oxidase-like deaminating enzyme
MLKDAPLLQSHSCHYEISASRNFIVAQHPQITNLLIAGGGNAEGFKFGPVMGQYVAERALGEGDPDFAKGFAIPEHDFEPPPPAPPAPPGQPAPIAKGTDCAPRSAQTVAHSQPPSD